MNDEDSLLPTLDLPGYITVKEAAKVLRLAEKTVYSYIDEGKLAAIRVASSVLVDKQAVQNYKRRSVGRPRKRIPKWRIPTGANLQYLTYISVGIRPGQEDKLGQILGEIHAGNKHFLPGTVARYIARGEEKTGDVQIVLIWRRAVMPPEEERQAALAALRKDLAEVLDWDTAQSESGRVLMHT